jgi:hypothetical protein
MDTLEEILDPLRKKYYRHPVSFNEYWLGRRPRDCKDRHGYWKRQRQIARSVVTCPVTLVPTGNAVGKSFLAAGLLHWFLSTRRGSLVVATAPTQVQLEEVLWKEVERAYRGARIPLGGRLLRSPLKVDLGGGWQALAYSTTKVERFSGHHAADLFAILDEASGVADEIYEAISSLNPSRELLMGNPLRPSGVFYDRCHARNPLANLISISSLESPHIGLERSPWGLADKTWLEKARADYGEGSLWWTCHVLGEFPDSGVDSVIPGSWLDRASDAPHQPGGPRRIAIDLAEGRGGDRSVVVVKDENGLIDLWSSTTASFEATAFQAAAMAQKYEVGDANISYDVAGIGADFGNRLRQFGIVAPIPYRGGNEGGPKHANFRSYSAWRLRQRLDPQRTDIQFGSELSVAPTIDDFVYHPARLAIDGRVRGGTSFIPRVQGLSRAQFSIPSRFLNGPLREELIGLRYELDLKGRVKLEVKEDYVERLKRSPDLADAFCQSFAFD